jgi:putative transposase
VVDDEMRLNALGKSGASRAARGSLWERSFHDRVIRDDSELKALRQYVCDNPLRWAVDRENPARGME